MRDSSNFTMVQLETFVQTILSYWHKQTLPVEQWEGKLLLLKEGDGGSFSDKCRHFIRASLSLLAEQDEMGTTILRERFLDRRIANDVALRHHVSRDKINRWQRGAILTLAKIISDQEEGVRAERRGVLNAGIPPASYDTLFGVEPNQQHIYDKLKDPNMPPTIALVGMGGVGKTSLAHSIATRCAQELAFDHILWLRVGSDDGIHTPLPDIQVNNFLTTLAGKLFPNTSNLLDMDGLKEKVRTQLKTKAYLIIIDNAEAQTLTQQLLSLIQDWGDPTKFILTSRSHPDRSFAVYNYPLPELSLDHAQQLIQHQATLSNVTALATVERVTTEKIYAVTGGNPLALKLVVGLTGIVPLTNILGDLTQSRFTQIEAMYTRIYKKAWCNLSSNAQAILRVMPLVADTGGLPAQIAAISGISDEGMLFAGILELANRSLLEVRGTLNERRYTIHRLTTSFLQTEINHWKA